MADALTLDAVHTRGDDIDTFELLLRFPEGSFDDRSALVVTSVMRLLPDPDTATLVERVGSRTVIAPIPGSIDLDTRSWRVRNVRCEFRARHANDGPVSAYVIDADGAAVAVEVRSPATTTPATSNDNANDNAGAEPTPAPSPVGGRRHSSVDELLPLPRSVITTGGEVARTLHLVEPGGVAGRAWASVMALARRLDERSTLLDAATSDSSGVSCQLDDRLGREEYRVALGPGGAVVIASTEVGFRHGFVTIAQWLRTRREGVSIDDGPVLAVRVVHLDLARRWFEPQIVLRLIDLAAWRKFSHVHLHLTDDEAWRVPIPGIPRLGDVGGTRGHGLAVGSLCGSGSAAYGRAYTRDEIGDWVRRADSLGITLVPEVDVPGHCHAALAALPELRDPADRSMASSIQGFDDNVLIPGHSDNDWFIDTVFSSIADLFPNSPHIHIGGDEVPSDAWTASPIARRFAADRRIDRRALYRDFVSSIIDRVHTATGRRVAAWEEAAVSGAMRPDDGYVVAWTSPDAARRLAERGFEVVVSPGQAYYLDMASSTEWTAPGASWAGHVPFERTAAFEPTAMWSAEAVRHLSGLQACIWSEHIASGEILDELVFPRLDAIADRAWGGHTAGSAEVYRHHPRFESGAIDS